MRVHTLLLVILALLGVLGAKASQGVIEINQADVEAAGGFPYVITAPGSYILTGNLTVESSNRGAIQIAADHVTLDLNGFVIQGPEDSEGDGVSSFDSGPNRFREDVHVRNGTVRGFKSGIRLGDGLVENVRAWATSSDAITARTGTVRNCFIRDSGGDGIVGAVVTDNTVIGTSGVGIRLRGRLASRNVVVANVEEAILVQGTAAALVSENVVSGSADEPEIVFEQAGSYARNYVTGLVEGGVAGDCNVINGVLECPLPATE